ncbi:MAG: hypothetical protein RJQ09_10420 [Cyclobacteriaceae bacterium]
MKLEVKSFLQVLIIGLLLITSCQESNQPSRELNLSEEFSDYWFAGKAELTSYKLQQARYGEVHDGEAVLIFVTEDFSNSKHVKLDRPNEAGTDLVKVMKLNFTKKFNTGIYPYSMMSSIFTPLNAVPGETLKVTTSSQEWCGHTFSQLNNVGGQLNLQTRSYFESEGDYNKSIEVGLMEDEIWNMIRLGPGKLPTGEITIMPSMMYLRLGHREAKMEPATGSLVEKGDSAIYNLNFKDFERKVEFIFSPSFPYQIISWSEEYTSGYGDNAQTLKTTATLNIRIMTDYWTKNSVADSVWRKKLNIN